MSDTTDKPIAKLYSGTADINWDSARWPNFSPVEIACRHCGEILLHMESMDALQRFRAIVGRPVLLNSAYRCPTHNHNVGGSPNSLHKLGQAFDVPLLARRTKKEMLQAAFEAGFHGLGTYSSFIHMDTGPKRNWNG